MYTAILLNVNSKDALKQKMGGWFNDDKFDDWRVYCHHLTLNMGSMDKGLNSTELLGKDATIEFDAVGWSDMATACRVTKLTTTCGTELKSKNKLPHVTMAVNIHDGGKPVMSNDIKTWIPVPPFALCGKVVEIGA